MKQNFHDKDAADGWQIKPKGCTPFLERCCNPNGGIRLQDIFDMQQKENVTQAQQCYTLLKEIYMEFADNGVFVECLHEMFMQYVTNVECSSETHLQVVETYRSLRLLLLDANEIFKHPPEIAKA